VRVIQHWLTCLNLCGGKVLGEALTTGERKLMVRHAETSPFLEYRDLAWVGDGWVEGDPVYIGQQCDPYNIAETGLCTALLLVVGVGVCSMIVSHASANLPVEDALSSERAKPQVECAPELTLDGLATFIGGGTRGCTVMRRRRSSALPWHPAKNQTASQSLRRCGRS